MIYPEKQPRANDIVRVGHSVNVLPRRKKNKKKYHKCLFSLDACPIYKTVGFHTRAQTLVHMNTAHTHSVRNTGRDNLMCP